MRFLGFDIIDANSENRSEVYHAFMQVDRPMLTRDRLLHQRILHAGKISFLIKSDLWKSQMKSVFDRFNLEVEIGMVGTRCMACNTQLESLDPSKAYHKVPEYVYHTQSVFMCCQSCEKVYWNGSHVDRLLMDMPVRVGRNGK